MNLRPHQDKAVQDIEAAWRRTPRVVYTLPTGGGKTHIKSAVAKRAQQGGLKILALAHRRELVSQISDRFKAFGIPHGIIQAGDPFNPWHTIQVCAVQTLIRRMERLPWEPNLIMIDEAHHAIAGSWRKVLDRWPHAHVLGVTATPERLDGKGLGDVFGQLVLGPSVKELQEMGYLAQYRYLAPPKNLAFMAEVSKVSKRAGDYARGELELAVNKRAIVGDAQRYYAEHLNGRPAIAFCVGIKHAQTVAEQFSAAGYRAASVDGKMKPEDRSRILKDFAEGRLSLLTSADLISEGFDVPECAGALLLRPTKSLTLFLQQVGRALRPKADGSPAIIIDHAGNCYDHGLPDETRKWSLEGREHREKDDAATVTQCKTCYRVFGQDDVKRIRFEKDCPDGEWSDCGLRRTAVELERELNQVDGELYEVTPEELYERDRPQWAGGISLSFAQGVEWETLLARADTKGKLAEIAKARGYKPGWVHHQWLSRGDRAAARRY